MATHRLWTPRSPREWEALAFLLLIAGSAVMLAWKAQWGWAVLCVAGICGAVYQEFIRPRRIHSGRADVARFRVLRALRATQLHVPHYFLEVDDGSIRGRFTLHLAGVWLFQFEPQDWRPRKFPSTEMAALPADDDADSVTGDSYRLEFTGEPFEPTVATREVPPLSTRPDWLRDGIEPIPVSYDDVLRFFTSDLDAPPAMSPEDFHRLFGPLAWRVRARRALRVESSIDKRLHHYVELDDGRVLHLCGRQLRDLEGGDDNARLFPCDEFEPMVLPASLLTLPRGVNPLGEPFQPAIALRTITGGDGDQGWVPRDWERIDRPFDEIAAHFGADWTERRQATSHEAAPADGHGNALRDGDDAVGGGDSPEDEGAPQIVEVARSSEGALPSLDEPVFSASRDEAPPGSTPSIGDAAGPHFGPDES